MPGRIVLLALVVFFIPGLSSRIAPSHDSLQAFITFWTYVSSLATEGRLPEWIPYGRYGTPATPILVYLTPMEYVTGVLGALAHRLWGFSDTLLLFKITIAVEYAIFAAGALRLGKLLFRSPWVNVVVAILAIFASPWIHNFAANAQSFLMTPWILAELTLAFESGRPKHLGRAALLSVFACVGNVPYFPPFLLLQLFVFSIPLALAWPRQLKPLLLNWRSWLWLALAAALAAIHFAALMKGMEGLAIYSQGRDPVTNRVPLPVFLTYAGVNQPLRLLGEVLYGFCTNGDNTYYLGLAPLVLVPLSFLMRPTPLLRAIQTLAVFLLLFSTGGLAAAASYSFPGMAFFRHVSLVFGVFRLLAFFCAGYVLDRCISDSYALSEWRTRLAGALRSPLFMLVALIAVADLVRAHLFGAPLRLSLIYYDPRISPLHLRLVIYLLSFLWLVRRSETRRSWPAVLMLVLVLDVMTFWAVGWLGWPKLDAAQAATVAQLSTPRGVRDAGPRFTSYDAEARGRLFEFVNNTRPLQHANSVMYVHAYFWTGEDPCVPRARTDFLTSSVAKFFETRGVHFAPNAKTEEKVLRDPVMRTVLACGQPRIASPARIIAFTRGYDWIRISLDNPHPHPVPLAVSEATHAGWTARIDLAPAQIRPPHGAFLGVSIPPGRHEAEFRFHLPLAASLRTLEGVLSGLLALALAIVSIREMAA